MGAARAASTSPRPFAPAVPDPDDEPLGFWSASRALTTCPVRLEKPEGGFAEAVRVLGQAELPQDHDAAGAELLTMPASPSGNELRSDQFPFDVDIPFTSIRSFSSTGKPCAGPGRCPVCARRPSAPLLQGVRVELRDPNAMGMPRREGGEPPLDAACASALPTACTAGCRRHRHPAARAADGSRRDASARAAPAAGAAAAWPRRGSPAAGRRRAPRV